MKLTFDSITIDGFGTTEYVLQAFDLGIENKNTSIDIHRSNYTRNISNYFNKAIRVFEAAFVASSELDYINKKRALKGKLQQNYTFTLTDEYMLNGVVTTAHTYTFEGYVIAVDFEDFYPQQRTQFQIQIYSEKPELLVTPSSSSTVPITGGGFGFPFGFPLGFGSANNVITANNTGTTTTFPLIEITGPGTDFRIEVTTAITQNKVFVFSDTLLSGQVLTINPAYANPIKATVDGLSVLGSTNSNFACLAINPGVNTFVFSVIENNNVNTEATLTFNSAVIDI